MTHAISPAPSRLADERLAALLQQSAALHAHLCPRQVLGVRMGLLGGRLLGLDVPQTGKRLLAFVETDGCAADGVAVATGCTVGHRTLRVIDFGKVAVTLVDVQTERAVRIAPSPHSRTRALDYAPEARSHWHAQLAAYQIMPDDELLIARPVVLRVSLEALLSKPGRRVTCEACGEEIISQLPPTKVGSLSLALPRQPSQATGLKARHPRRTAG